MSAQVSAARLSIQQRQELEARLLEFDQQWRRGLFAEWTREMPPELSEAESLVLHELMKIDLERNWSDGNRKTVEDYLTALPQLGDAKTVSADLLMTEYEARRVAGEADPFAELSRRFPERAADLKQLIEAEEPHRSFAHKVAVARDTGRSKSDTHSVAAKTPKAAARHTAAESRGATGETDLPETFGRYRIQKRLGAGAMGAVYLARDSQLDRQVALKTPTFTGSDSKELVERFYREARSAANLRHANICPVFDVGEIDGVHYISMAYIKGRPLSDFIKPGETIPERTAASLIRKLALGLEHAHAEGIIHRDLKPANIMIDKQREPVIMDFGLARKLGTRNESRVTQEGMILGTPAYMSPEQVEGDLNAGPLCDVYSLGVILYELLTGRLPFEGSVTAIIGQILVKEPPKPTEYRPDLDPAMEAICLKMIAKKTDDRYASMKAAAAALTDYLKKPKPTASPAQTDHGESTRTISDETGLQALFEATSESGPSIKDRAGVKQRTPKKAPAAAPSKPAMKLAERWKSLPPKWKASVATAIAATLLLASIVLIFRTPSGGTLRIEVNDPNIEVLVDGETITLKDKTWEGKQDAKKHTLSVKIGGQTIKLGSPVVKLPDGRTGKLTLQLNGAELTSNSFEIVRGETTVVKISYQKPETLPPKPPGPADATEFGGHRYKFYKDVVSWTEAKHRCEKLGGHLVIIETKAENDFVTQLAIDGFSKNGKRDSIWIGLSQPKHDGKWFWVNGVPLTYKNWAVTQPSRKESEFYAAMLLRGTIRYPNGVWADIAVKGPRRMVPRGYVCEWSEGNPPPTPLTPLPDGPEKPGTGGPSISGSGPGGWISLFDGKTLDGWENSGKIWKLEDGAIVGRHDNPRRSMTIFHKTAFTDFVLKCEFKLEAGAAHIVFRSDRSRISLRKTTGYHFKLVGLPLPIKKSIRNYAWTLRGGLTGAYQPIGSLDPQETLKQLAALDLKTWNKCEITAVGNRFKIVVNGITVLDDADEKKTHNAGSIGFALWAGRKASVAFRNIKIKPLTPLPDGPPGELSNLKFDTQTPVAAMALSPDGLHVAVGGSSLTDQFRVYDITTSEIVSGFKHGAKVTHLAYTSDGSRIVSAGVDNTVRVWDVSNPGKPPVTIDGFQNPIFGMALLPWDKRVIVLEKDGSPRRDQLSGQDAKVGVVHIRDIESGKKLFPPQKIGFAYAMSVSRAGRSVALALRDNYNVYDLKTDGKVALQNSRLLHRPYRNQGGLVNGPLVFSPDGMFAVGSLRRAREARKCRFALWNIVTGKQIHRFDREFEDKVPVKTTLAFTPDGKHILAGTPDGKVKLWDRDTGTLVHEFKGHTGRVTAVAVTPDNRFAVTAGDSTIRIWRLPKLQQVGFAAQRKAAVFLLRRPGVTVTVEVDGKQKGVMSADKLPAAAFTVVGIGLNRQRNLTDEEFARLAQFPSLRSLKIFFSPLTDDMLRHVGRLSNLEILYLKRTGIGDAGLAHIKGLRKLKKLHLYGTKVSDVGLQHLTDMQSLWWLALGNTNVTGSKLDALKSLKSLWQLSLGGPKFTKKSAALSVLKKMTSLGRLGIGGVKLSEQEKKDLKRALPNCRIAYSAVAVEDDLDDDTAVWTPLMKSAAELKPNPRVTFAKETLSLDWSGGMVAAPFTKATGRDISVRAQIKKTGTAGSFEMELRRDQKLFSGYVLSSDGHTWARIKRRDRLFKLTDLAETTTIPVKPGAEAEWTFSAVGDTLTVLVNGKPILTAKDSTFKEGFVVFSTWNCQTEFRTPEFHVIR